LVRELYVSIDVLQPGRLTKADELIELIPGDEAIGCCSELSPP
jgi:hypothetical protein